MMFWRNPFFTKKTRKEGISFVRKLNENGSYWEPDQYPHTVWVPAKSQTLDPALLSRYDSPIPEHSLETLWTTISCSKTSMVRLLLVTLDLTAEMAPQRKPFGCPGKLLMYCLLLHLYPCRQKMPVISFDTCILHTITTLMLLERISMLTLSIMLKPLRATTMFTEINHIMLAILFRSHLQRCGWLRKPNSCAGLCLQVYIMDNR